MSGEETKRPTAQGISRLLAEAGFQRSTTSKSRIRGMPNIGAGYHVETYSPGIVHVRYRSDYALSRRQHEMLGKYAAAIQAAGWQVTEPDAGATGYFAKLTVTPLPGQRLVC